MRDRRCRRLVPLLLSLLVVLPAGAETRDEFDRRITAELRARDAGAADLFAQANAARERGDHAAAIELYSRVRAKHPAFTHATRRLCGEKLATGMRAEAIALCREAVMADPSPLNQATLAQALVTTPGEAPPSDEDKKAAASMCDNLIRSSGDDLSVQQMCTPVAFATGSIATAIAGATNLERLAPDDLETVYFAAVAHAVQGEFLRADLDLWRARRRGLADEEYARLRGSFHEAWPLWLTAAIWSAFGVAIWLVLALVLLAAGAALSRATLAEAQRIAGTQAGTGTTRQGGALRRIYAFVIGVAGMAYFLSLPLLLVVVLLTGGGVILGLLSLGHVPLNLIFALFVGVVATCWAILKSLVVLGRDEEPGLRAEMDQHPRLQALLAAVAGEIGTRPVDSVYLLPGTEFAVMERGGLLQRLQGRAERCLLIGVGVLEGFRLRPFEAVLAHEYGHFVNKDTAGGRFSLAVRRSIFRMAGGLAGSGAANWLNPAWLFLLAFGSLFQRISQGASRLQEVMADRWAVAVYGSQAFIDGLRHVIERSVRFDAQVGATLTDFAGRQDDIPDLYAYRPAQPPPESDIQEAVALALAAPASPYDSHPSPAQRFDWATRLGGPGSAVEGSSEDAWVLFANRPAIEAAMTDRFLGRA